VKQVAISEEAAIERSRRRIARSLGAHSGRAKTGGAPGASPSVTAAASPTIPAARSSRSGRSFQIAPPSLTHSTAGGETWGY
jgi:hypothetical protein